MAHKKSNPRNLLVLPVHNENNQVAQVCKDLKVFLHTNRFTSVLVVDDGSTDGTPESFRRCLAGVSRTSVLALPDNGGKGRAIRIAFAKAKADFFVFMDGDLAYSFDHLQPMLAALEKHDMVIGSRSMAPQPQGGLPARRAFLGWAFNRLACLLLGFDYPDTQAGLKGFTRGGGQKLFSIQKLNDFAFDAELLYLAKKLGLSVGQIPAQVSGQHTYKTSQVKLLVDSLRCLMDFLLVRWWSATRAYNLP
ncbi:MAG: glycosyltransferase family 2 protein [Verrucomicrobia bacterium]|nr:glycosyltransferase family 2 protein [Verrucomicrobiota bacterium]